MPAWAFLSPVPTPSPGLYDRISHPRDPAHPSGELGAAGQDLQPTEQGEHLLPQSFLPVLIDPSFLQDGVATFSLLAIR